MTTIAVAERTLKGLQVPLDPYQKLADRNARHLKERGLKPGEIQFFLPTENGPVVIKLQVRDASEYRMVPRKNIFAIQDTEEFHSHQLKLVQDAYKLGPERAMNYLAENPVVAVIIPGARVIHRDNPEGSSLIAAIDGEHRAREAGIFGNALINLPVAFFTLEQIFAGIIRKSSGPNISLEMVRKSLVNSVNESVADFVGDEVSSDSMESRARRGMPASKLPSLFTGSINQLPTFTYRGPGTITK